MEAHHQDKTHAQVSWCPQQWEKGRRTWQSRSPAQIGGIAHYMAIAAVLSDRPQDSCSSVGDDPSTVIIPSTWGRESPWCSLPQLRSWPGQFQGLPSIFQMQSATGCFRAQAATQG